MTKVVTRAIDKYGSMMPTELRLFMDESPKDDIDWGLIMYLLENTRRGNIITLGKMSSFFDIDKELLFDRLNRMSGLWVRQYMNSAGYGKTYYTYEINEIATGFLVHLVGYWRKLIETKKQ